MIAAGAPVRRQVLFELILREIRNRFAGARFGLIWSLLNPAIQLASYTLIFGYLYKGPVSQDGPPFVASLFCGLWAWWGFHEGVMRGLAALVENGSLLRKVPIPPATCVVAASTASVLLQLVGFCLFLAVFGLVGVAPPRMSWLGLPGVVVLGWVLTSGFALVLAPVHLLVRDTVHVVSALLTIGFFVSPVLYASDWLPAGIRGVAELNPMTGLLGLYRTSVLGTPVPSDMALFSMTTGIVLSLFVARTLYVRLDRVLDEYW